MEFKFSKFVFSNLCLFPMTAVALGSICWPDVVMWSWFQLLFKPNGSKITGSCTPPYKPPTIVENESILMHCDDGFEARPQNRSLFEKPESSKGLFKPNGQDLQGMPV